MRMDLVVYVSSIYLAKNLALSITIRLSCLYSILVIKNINIMLNKRAVNVELKATPRLVVIPVMSPSIASAAWDNASPIPLTVPINPIDGIAQEIYLINERSNWNKSNLFSIKIEYIYLFEVSLSIFSLSSSSNGSLLFSSDL